MRTCLLQTHSRVNEELFRLTLPNHAEYAGTHGYDMLQLHRTYEEVWWGIEDLVLDASRRYDRVLQVGSDVLFTNMSVPLDHFCDGTHAVFIQDEGCGYPCVNFDVVIWQGAEGTQSVIEMLRKTRPLYETHRFGVQTGMTLLSKDPAMAGLIKTYPPRFMQSAPFIGYPAAWQPGDFSLHCLGLSNANKYKRCKHYLDTGELIWSGR
jgi:hypothetical protein